MISNSIIQWLLKGDPSIRWQVMRDLMNLGKDIVDGERNRVAKEGWGNQLLEAIRAKLPIMLFEYPVYLADIKGKGLRVVSLGDQISGKDQHGLVTIAPEII